MIKIISIQNKVIEKGKIPLRAKDIPYQPEARLEHLNRNGLPIIGSVLQPGDILVGICRSTRYLNEGEREIANLGLHYAGGPGLWKDDSVLYQENSPAVIKDVSCVWNGDYSAHTFAPFAYDHESNPMCWLLECCDIPAGTLLEEIKIVLELVDE